MNEFLSLCRYAAFYIVTIWQFFFLVRAIMSWIPSAQGGRFAYIVHALTEPLMAPFRKLLSHIPALRRSPIDLSFLCALIVLAVAGWFLV